MDEKLNDTTQQDAISVIETGIQEEIVIEVDESIGWVGGDNTLHYSMAGRDKDDQHPISAITGLRHELDQIKSLQTVSSDKVGFANYYEWCDGEHNETGYFVTIEPGTSLIKICDGSGIFGVVVDDAGFVGGQSGITLDYVNGVANTYAAARDDSYGLVATSGLVSVRCESDVVKGDCVVSNAYGMATKTESGFGYQVLSIEYKNGVNYASIVLGVQSCTTDLIGKKLQYLNGRIGDAESNINVAMNAANQAYNKAAQSGTVSDDAVLKALEAISKADGALNATDAMNSTLSAVSKTAEQARAIAEGAVNSANEIRKEAGETANSALSNVNALVEKFEPMDEWVDPVTGQVGAEYIIAYMDSQGLATKSEVQTVESISEENKSLIEKNAQSITTLISSVDKYSVGEYSQAYGLTLEQARIILKEGMIYIPTKHGDVATHSEKYNDGENTAFERAFTNGYFYEWTAIEDGAMMWSEKLGRVWFGTEQPVGDAYTYWYDGDKLYLSNSGEWIEVATLAGNINNRITSAIRQDVDKISAEIVNAYGAVAGFGAKLSEMDANVHSIASWPTDGGTHNMAILESKSDGNEAYLVLAAVTDVNGSPAVTELNGAKIILRDSNKNGASYIQIDADQIAFTGEVTFLKPEDLGEHGATVIDGARVKTGTLSADTISGGTIDAKDVIIVNLDADQITSGAIKADFIDATDLKVQAANIEGELTAGQIDATDLQVDAANITGTLTFGQLPQNVATEEQVTTITNNTISTTNVYAQNLEISSVNINGKLTAEQIEANVITAATLSGAIASLSLVQTKSLSSSSITVSGAANIGGYTDAQGGIGCSVGTKTFMLGASENRISGGGTLLGSWYINGSEAVTSDINFKNTITPLSDNYSVLFDHLVPVTYKYNDGTSDRIHTGFIAQDVEKAILAAGLTTKDFAGFIRATETDDNGNEYQKCYLRYDEFIALNTREVQKLKDEVSILKAEIAELKAIINRGEV